MSRDGSYLPWLVALLREQDASKCQWWIHH